MKNQQVKNLRGKVSALDRRSRNDLRKVELNSKAGFNKKTIIENLPAIPSLQRPNLRKTIAVIFHKLSVPRDPRGIKVTKLSLSVLSGSPMSKVQCTNRTRIGKMMLSSNKNNMVKVVRKLVTKESPTKSCPMQILRSSRNFPMSKNLQKMQVVQQLKTITACNNRKISQKISEIIKGQKIKD